MNMEKVHFKLYKDGKKWVVAGVAIGIMTLYGGTTALADTNVNVSHTTDEATSAVNTESSKANQANDTAKTAETTSNVASSASLNNNSDTNMSVSSDTKSASNDGSSNTNLDAKTREANQEATSNSSVTGSANNSSASVSSSASASAINSVSKRAVKASAVVTTQQTPTVTTDGGTSFPAISGQMNALFETNVTMNDNQVIHVGDQIVWQMPTGKWDYSKFSILGSALNYGTLTTDASNNQAIYTFDKISSDLTGASLSQGRLQFYLHYIDTAWTVDTTTTYGDVTGIYKSGTGSSQFSVTNSDVVMKPASDVSPSALRPIAGGYGYYGYLPDKDNYLQGETFWPSQNSMSFNVVMNPDNAFTDDTNVTLNFSTSSGVKFNTDGFYYVTDNGIMNKLNVTTNSDGSVSLKFPVMTGIYYDKILFSIIPGSTNPNVTYMTKITYASDQHPTGSLSDAVNPIYIPAMFVNANTKGFIPFVTAPNKSLNNSTDTVSDVDSWLLSGVSASDVEDDAKGLAVPFEIKKDANYDTLVQAINSHKNGTFQVTIVATDSDGNVSNQIELSNGTIQNLPNGTFTVTLYSNILLHFVDGSGNQIQPDVTLNGQAGVAFNTNSYTTIVGSDGKVYSLQNPTSGTFGENGQPIELTLTYNVQQWALDASDVTHYVGDPVPGNDAFDVKASDATGNDASSQVIINTSSVNWNVPGQYVVTFTLPRDNSLGGNIVVTRSVYVKANQKSLIAQDYTMYVGDAKPTVIDFGASAQDRDGVAEAISIDFSQVNWNTAGAYNVVLSTTDGQSKTVTLTILANQKSISGQDYTMHVGDPKATVSDFKASATDIDGNPEPITADLSQVDWNTAGTYNVVLSTGDGQSKTVTLTILANQKSISGQDYTMHVGDPKATVSDFNASATDIDGKAEPVTADFSQVNWDVAGAYSVVLSTTDGQSKTVTLTILANQKSISGQDYTMHVGDSKATVSDFKASATDIDGKSEVVTADLSQVDWNTAGIYNVVLSTDDGQSKTVALTILANQKSISGQDYTMHVGDPKATVSDFKASATDIDGKSEVVTADLSQVDWNVAGVYNVVLSTADGQRKTVKLIILAKQNPNDGNGNNNNQGNKDNQGNKNKPGKDSGKGVNNNTNVNTKSANAVMKKDTAPKIVTTVQQGNKATKLEVKTSSEVSNNGMKEVATSETRLPQTGDSKDNTSVLGLVLISLTSLFGLLGIRRKK